MLISTTSGQTKQELSNGSVTREILEEGRSIFKQRDGRAVEFRDPEPNRAPQNVDVDRVVAVGNSISHRDDAPMFRDPIRNG